MPSQLLQITRADCMPSQSLQISRPDCMPSHVLGDHTGGVCPVSSPCRLHGRTVCRLSSCRSHGRTVCPLSRCRSHGRTVCRLTSLEITRAECVPSPVLADYTGGLYALSAAADLTGGLYAVSRPWRSGAPPSAGPAALGRPPPGLAVFGGFQSPPTKQVGLTVNWQPAGNG